MKNKLKNLLNILGVVVAVSFLDGFLALGMHEGWYVIIGLVMVVAVIWALKIVHGEEFKQLK